MRQSNKAADPVMSKLKSTVSSWNAPLQPSRPFRPPLPTFYPSSST
jgi:hypothetical protein